MPVETLEPAGRILGKETALRAHAQGRDLHAVARGDLVPAALLQPLLVQQLLLACFQAGQCGRHDARAFGVQPIERARCTCKNICWTRSWASLLRLPRRMKERVKIGAQLRNSSANA